MVILPSQDQLLLRELMQMVVIEKETQNLLLQSNSFDTTWVNFNTSDTGGQSGYDGSSNAWLISNTGASGHIRNKTNLLKCVTGIQVEYIQLLFMLKAGTHSIVQIKGYEPKR